MHNGVAMQFTQDPVSRTTPYPPLVATFPAAHADGTGIMSVTVGYKEGVSEKLGFIGTHAMYEGAVAIDGRKVFEFDSIGVMIKSGRAVNCVNALKEAVGAAVSFSSSTIGSEREAHHRNASQHREIWKLAQREVADELSRTRARETVSMSMSL
jgi:hypothetical protein